MATEYLECQNGHREMRTSRLGMICSFPLQGGGYCQGILQDPGNPIRVVRTAEGKVVPVEPFKEAPAAIC